MNKKRIIIGVIIGFILLLIIIGVIFIIKSKPKTESDAEVLDSMMPSSPGAISGGSGGYVENSFPLKQGQKGNLVMNVQKYLGSNSACINSFKLAGASIPAPDGVFGPITEKALKACKGVTQVSQTLYNEMMTAPVSAPSSSASSSFKKGDKIYLSGDQSMLYSFPENKGTYFVGKVSKALFLDKPFGTFDSDASNGFAKINVIGYEPYNPSTGGYNQFKAEAKSVFIYKTALRKTAY